MLPSMITATRLATPPKTHVRNITNFTTRLATSLYPYLSKRQQQCLVNRVCGDDNIQYYPVEAGSLTFLSIPDKETLSNTRLMTDGLHFCIFVTARIQMEDGRYEVLGIHHDGSTKSREILAEFAQHLGKAKQRKNTQIDITTMQNKVNFASLGDSSALSDLQNQTNKDVINALEAYDLPLKEQDITSSSKTMIYNPCTLQIRKSFLGIEPLSLRTKSLSHAGSRL